MAGITDWITQNLDPRQILADAKGIGNFFDPARPFNQQAAGLQQGSEDAKALSALEWKRQMEGLAQALGYQQKSQNTLDSVYAAGAKPGTALPVGLMPPTAGVAPMPMGPGANAGGMPGLGGYMQGRR